jgi:hypothetical protein
VKDFDYWFFMGLLALLLLASLVAPWLRRGSEEGE